MSNMVVIKLFIYSMPKSVPIGYVKAEMLIGKWFKGLVVFS